MFRSLWPDKFSGPLWRDTFSGPWWLESFSVPCGQISCQARSVVWWPDSRAGLGQGVCNKLALGLLFPRPTGTGPGIWGWGTFLLVQGSFHQFKGVSCSCCGLPNACVAPLATAGWLLCLAKFHNPQVCISLQQRSGLHTSWDIVLYWENKGTAKIEAQWIICSEIPNNSHNTKLP